MQEEIEEMRNIFLTVLTRNLWLCEKETSWVMFGNSDQVNYNCSSM